MIKVAITAQNRPRGLIAPVASMVRDINTDGLEYSDGAYFSNCKVQGNPRRVGDLLRAFGLQFQEENFAITSFVGMLRGRKSDLHTGLIGQLKDRPLVDIGAGSASEGYTLARVLGASCYIGIEGYFARELFASICRQASLHDEKYPAIGFSVISEDMLAALKRFPSDSVNVFASSLDNLILGKEYMLKVAGEIARVQLEDGLFVSVCSDMATAGKMSMLDLAKCYAKPKELFGMA